MNYAEERSRMLILAARDGNIDFVEELLEFPGINVNIQDHNGNTALMLASKNGHTDIVNTLLNYYNENNDGDIVYTASVNRQGRNALMLAVMNNHYDIAETLLKDEYIEERDFSFDLEDINGNTVLMLAQRTGNDELVDLIAARLPNNNNGNNGNNNNGNNGDNNNGNNNGNNNNLGGGARHRRKTRKTNKRKRSNRRQAKRTRR
jgi:serine/threonine-protein phosphatase 6 regulatory ankyrin repeat subunit B